MKIKYVVQTCDHLKMGCDTGSKEIKFVKF